MNLTLRNTENLGAPSLQAVHLVYSSRNRETRLHQTSSLQCALNIYKSFRDYSSESGLVVKNTIQLAETEMCGS
jgi:hypothetical protein